MLHICIATKQHASKNPAGIPTQDRTLGSHASSPLGHADSLKEHVQLIEINAFLKKENRY